MKQTTLHAWKEWKLRCALKECCLESQQIVGSWGAAILRGALRKMRPRHDLAHVPEKESNLLDPAWSAMEVHLVAGKKAAGKRFKDSLFDVISTQLTDEGKRNALEKYFTASAYNVAKRIAGKRSPDKDVSERAREDGVVVIPLDKVIDDDDRDGHTIEEAVRHLDYLVLTPDSIAAYQELKELARKEAVAWVANMPQRLILVCGCLADDRSLNDEQLFGLADCGRAQLYKAQHAAKAELVKFKEAVEAKHRQPNADRATLQELATCALAELFNLCREVLPPEKIKNRRLYTRER